MTQEYKSFSPEEFRLHNEKLQAEMEKQDIDMLLLSTPENIILFHWLPLLVYIQPFQAGICAGAQEGGSGYYTEDTGEDHGTVYQLDQPYLLLGNSQQKPGASGGGGAGQHH